jgi:hypothetical protein
MIYSNNFHLTIFKATNPGIAALETATLLLLFMLTRSITHAQ